MQSATQPHAKLAEGPIPAQQSMQSEEPVAASEQQLDTAVQFDTDAHVKAVFCSVWMTDQTWV